VIPIYTIAMLNLHGRPHGSIRINTEDIDILTAYLRAVSMAGIRKGRRMEKKKNETKDGKP